MLDVVAEQKCCNYRLFTHVGQGIRGEADLA